MMHILQVYGNATDLLKADFQQIEKSQSNLIRKKVSVRLKTGAIIQAFRWVDSETGKSPTLEHPKMTKDLPDGHEEGEALINHISLNNQKSKLWDKLIGAGIYDPEKIAEIGGDTKTDIKYHMKVRGFDHTKFEEPKGGLNLPSQPLLDSGDLSDVSVQREAISEIQMRLGSKAAREEQIKRGREYSQKFGITSDDQWDGYEQDLSMLVNDRLGLRAVLAYGMGGIGKTFMMETVFEKKGLIAYDPDMDMTEDEYDFIVISGKSGSKTTQRAMYEHSNKIIVFDDCDSIWNDENIINVLKASLDTSGKGRCQWAMPLAETVKGAKDDVPASFRFNGQMVFITNLSKKELVEKGAGPVSESRAASSDLTMDMDETMRRLRKILPGVNVKRKDRTIDDSVTMEDKEMALEALDQVKDLALLEQLNTRVLTQCIAAASFQRQEFGEYRMPALKRIFTKQFGLN